MLTKKFQMSKLGLEKEKELEIKLPTFEKAKEFQEKKKYIYIYIWFMNWSKAFDFNQSHDKMWKIFRKIGTPDHLICLLYADQESTVRILYGTTDWFKIKNGV